MCTDIAEGRLQPLSSVFDCRMISTWKTTEQPMAGFVEKLRRLEETEEIISISFCHGFPWSDSEHNGAKVLVYANGNEAYATQTAVETGKEIWSMRHETHPQYPGIDEALTRACAAGRHPVVIADTADNAGGGAPADATFILEQVLLRNISQVASGVYWDSESVARCKTAGSGAITDCNWAARMVWYPEIPCN